MWTIDLPGICDKVTSSIFSSPKEPFHSGSRRDGPSITGREAEIKGAEEFKRWGERCNATEKRGCFLGSVLQEYFALSRISESNIVIKSVTLSASNKSETEKRDLWEA